ncbi:MAG: hypothetical protein JOZ07_04545 [Solirubrobacterales bacterium]|nr:hypothetical protein [Solirubrobacterales bacterium]
MPKQRVTRVEQRSSMAAFEQMRDWSDEDLAVETKARAAAQAVLGLRAAEKYDAKRARAHFQKAIAAAPPQERMQLRRMADLSLAQAERRAGDFQKAAERVGAPVKKGQVRFLRFIGLIAPPSSDGPVARVRGIAIAVALVIAILLIGFGLVNLVALPFGGISLDLGIFYGVLLVLIAVGVAVFLGRRRQRRAQAQASASR